MTKRKIYPGQKDYVEKDLYDLKSGKTHTEKIRIDCFDCTKSYYQCNTCLRWACTDHTKITTRGMNVSKYTCVDCEGVDN